MDRDKRWERTKRAYDAMVHGIGEHRATPARRSGWLYEAGIGDEFIEPR